MFDRLFATSGLSLDRLRALVEVGASGSIAKAAKGDAVKQSQYSRQIKELEAFFQITLIERHGQGIRLTAQGRELARISRFSLLGLSNFQRGCLTEQHTYRIGSGSTFGRRWLLPLLSQSATLQIGDRYVVEMLKDDEIERRLHDLTLDFAVTTAVRISRPLQLAEIGLWRLNCWVPKSLCQTEVAAQRALKEKRLPLILVNELPALGQTALQDHDARLRCTDFSEASAALHHRALAALLPDFFQPESENLWCVPLPKGHVYHYRLAWNPRLLRLNTHAIRTRDFLLTSLKAAFARSSGPLGAVARPAPH